MSIRIPPDADQNTRNAFLDIEERLAALEAKQAELDATGLLSALDQQTETLEDPDLEVDGDLVVNGDITVDGNVTMDSLYEGLLHLIPSGKAGTSTAQRTFNMHGSLVIAPGGLSVDSITCRVINVEYLNVKGTAVP